jgi:hypothetical protein
MIDTLTKPHCANRYRAPVDAEPSTLSTVAVSAAIVRETASQV